MPVTQVSQLGRYKITGTLGRGAMGVVYKAYDPLIDRPVAIKTVDHTTLTPVEAEDFERRFKREAKSAGRLNHPNIVTIHDVGRCGDLSYIAMEFLVGRSLRDILDSGYELSLLRIAEIAAQIADGLAFAHINDVVHRDIKPANIMVLDHDVVKITDFGVALLPSGAHTLDGTGTACGSPKYMSPEQINGKKADGRSDIFSLGSVLYEMLSGRAPFDGDDLGAILYQVINNAPPLPSSYYPSLPHDFDRIVARAMAKNPEKRYQNAAEMSSDLRKYRRYAKQAQKKQSSEAAPQVAKPAAPAAIGDATLPAVADDVVAQAKRAGVRARVLHFGVPLLAVAVVAGGLLLRPETDSSPPLAATVTPAAASTPAAVVETVANSPFVEPAATLALAAPTESVASAAPALEASEPLVASPAPPVATPIPVVADGRLRMAVSPWGEVYVDNKKIGVSPPLSEFRVPPGKHKIEIRNGNFPPYQQNVDLAANASVRIKHKFE